LSRNANAWDSGSTPEELALMRDFRRESTADAIKQKATALATRSIPFVSLSALIAALAPNEGALRDSYLEKIADGPVTFGGDDMLACLVTPEYVARTCGIGERVVKNHVPHGHYVDLQS